MKKAFLFSLLLGISFCGFTQNATYKIEFISTWSATTHPTDYPTGQAHYSPLVGATHSDAITFFSHGQIATDGVESVAESGANATLKNEFQIAINNGQANQIFEGSGLNSGPGTIAIENVIVDMAFPELSLITMIAPSPDWVAMINNVSLIDGEGDWIVELSIPVFATDAGTDSGPTYTSDNADTNPKQAMASLENMVPFSALILGTFKITLQSVLGVDDVARSKNLQVYPNPSNGSITLNHPEIDTPSTISVYSSTGQLRLTKKLSGTNQLYLENLPQGLYFLRVMINSRMYSRKLVID